jgi:hypothetical protein
MFRSDPDGIVDPDGIRADGIPMAPGVSPSLGDPVARQRGFAPELAGKGGLVPMSLWLTVQVRFRPSHFLQTLLDDLAGALRVRLTPLTTPLRSAKKSLWIRVTKSSVKIFLLSVVGCASIDECRG